VRAQSPAGFSPGFPQAWARRVKLTRCAGRTSYLVHEKAFERHHENVDDVHGDLVRWPQRQNAAEYNYRHEWVARHLTWSCAGAERRVIVVAVSRPELRTEEPAKRCPDCALHNQRDSEAPILFGTQCRLQTSHELVCLQLFFDRNRIRRAPRLQPVAPPPRPQEVQHGPSRRHDHDRSRNKRSEMVVGHLLG